MDDGTLRILDRYSSIDDLVRDIDQKLSAADMDRALTLAFQFVQDVFADQRAIAKVFASETLDRAVNRIGAQALAGMPPRTESTASGTLTVFLASELYSTGGHTAVIEDLLRTGAFPGTARILLTDVFGRADIDVIKARFAPLGIEIESAPAGDLADRLQWVLRRLVALRPQSLLLFQHHQDSVAVAAAQPGLAQRIIFYHHADHHLCLGVTLPHLRHVDLSPMAYHQCRDDVGVTANVYWPLACEDFGAPVAHQRSVTAGTALRTCSAGTRNKFEQPYQYDYADIVPRILATTGGSHVHIGLLSETTLDRMYGRMTEFGVAADRLLYLEWVPSVWKALHEHAVDVYLASFPIAGGRVAVEAMGSGTPVIAHQSYLSRFHGNADMLYPTAFAWRTPEELLAHMAGLTADAVRAESAAARAHYEQEHTYAALGKAILAGESAPPAPALRPYKPDPMQSFLDDLQYANGRTIALSRAINRLEEERRALQRTLDDVYRSRTWNLALKFQRFATALRGRRTDAGAR